MSKLYIQNPEGNPDNRPTYPDGTPKKKFEVVTMPAEGGGLKNAVFIEGIELDWSIDLNSLAEAMKMGPRYFKEVQASMVRHYLECVSDMVGRKVTPAELQEATKTGWI